MTTYKQCITILLTTIFGFGLAGCGGSGGGGGGGGGAAAPATTTGVFIDSPVSGLSYSCSSGAGGLTNSSGQFTCNTGDSVTFSLGNYIIGGCIVANEVTPYSLYPDNAEAAVNVAQILQTIDDATDGSIAIPFDYSELDAVVTAPTDSSFEADIQAVLGVTLVTEAVASDHLNATLGLPSVTDGFTADWIEGKTLYQVILDTEDDDNDGSTTDWLLVAAKYENGIRSLDFSADGTFEVTTDTFVIASGVLTITDGADIETETITAVDNTKITVNFHVSWGDPDETVYEFFTKADAQAYLDELNAPSVEEFNMVYTNTFADTVTPCNNRTPPSPHNLVLVTTKNNYVCSLSDVPQTSCDVFDTADVTGIAGSIDMYYDFGTTEENNNRGQAIRRQSDNTISGLWVINIFINGEFQGTTESGPVILTKQ